MGGAGGIIDSAELGFEARLHTFVSNGWPDLMYSLIYMSIACFLVYYILTAPIL